MIFSKRIKLRIVNEYEWAEYPQGLTCVSYDCNGGKDLAKKILSYDSEKFQDGKVYTFRNLKEVKKFIDESPIQFTEEHKECWCFPWAYDVLSCRLSISDDEPNTLIFTISGHEEFNE